MTSTACCIGSVDVVQGLQDHHQDKFGDWTVDDFDAAALRGNVPVLRLLSLALYDGIKKLANTPPLNRICTSEVLKEMHMKSSVMFMLCVREKTEPYVMAKLLDVLRDLITDSESCTLVATVLLADAR